MEFEKLETYRQVLFSHVYFQKIQRIEEQIRTWTQHKDKHKKIIQGLQTFAFELSLNCVVPLGKRALMKGKLTHTNEILVCIGDGYFAKYSTQQAIALCNRRIKRSEEILKKLEDERNLLEMRQILPQNCGAFEFDECKEIIENWDEKQLEDWKVEHRKREKAYRQKLIKLKHVKKKEVLTEDDIFHRLDELELAEELADEFNSLEEELQNFYGQDIQNEKAHQDLDEGLQKKKENKEEKQGRNACEQQEKSREEISEYANVVDATVNEQLHHRSELKLDQQKHMNLSKIAKIEKINGTIQNIVKDTVDIAINKETKINGKFEVSIIKEDEVEKMLGRQQNLSLDSHTSKSFAFENKKNKNRKGTLFHNSDGLEPNLHCEKSKTGLSKKVSFVEPSFKEMNTVIDQNNGLDRFKDVKEMSNKGDLSVNENDDIIKIDFKHTKTQLLNVDGFKNEVTSPRDIYRIFYKPKSILKRSLDNYHYINKIIPLNEHDIQDCTDKDIDEKSTYNLVVQDVQEKKIKNVVIQSNAPIEKKRPISRFKLDRSNIKK